MKTYLSPWKRRRGRLLGALISMTLFCAMGGVATSLGRAGPWIGIEFCLGISAFIFVCTAGWIFLD